MNKKLILALSLGILILCVSFLAYSVATEKTYSNINSFEECADAGFPVNFMYPPTCRTPDGRIFTGPKETPTPDVNPNRGCVDQCGNGVCQEIVCEATGCPCAETTDSCTADCS